MTPKIVCDEYVVTARPHSVTRPYRICVAADLHAADGSEALRCIAAVSPNFILAPGDICEDLTGNVSDDDRGLLFLKSASTLAPVFYTPGNHEYHRAHRRRSSWQTNDGCLSEAARRALNMPGLTLLEDSCVTFGEFCIGAMCPGDRYPDRKPRTAVLSKMESHDGFRLLLCHQPEYYPMFVKSHDIDLTCSGHAHGGQWRAFGHGVYAPGQGVFPRYTRGVYDNRLLVSAGLGNPVPVPRFGNPRQLLIFTVLPSN